MADKDQPTKRSGDPGLSGLSADLDAPSPDGATAAAPGAGGAPRTGYGNYGSHGAQAAEEFQIADYLRILYKRRWLAGTVFIVVFGMVALQTFTAVSVYEARVQVLIENEENNTVSFEDVISQRVAPDYYQTQYRLLTSRALAKRAMDAGKFWTHPLFAPKPGSSSGFSVRSAISGAVGSVASLLRPSPPPMATDGRETETRAQSALIDAFLSGLEVEGIRNSRLVELRYSSRDPRLAADAANAIAQAYIEQNLDFRFQSSKDATEFLTKQMAQQRLEVEASEQALQQYREDHDAVSLEDRQNVVVQRLGELTNAVTRARTELIAKEARYNQIREARTDDRIDSVPAVLANGFIQGLKTQLADHQRREAEMAETLADKHPQLATLRTAIATLEKRIATEIDRVVDSVRVEFEAARDEERKLSASLEAQKQEAMNLGRRSIDYGALQRDAQTNRELYNTLLQRTKETGIAGEVRSNNIRIVDPAEVPNRPARPNRPLNLAVGFAGALLLAAAVGFFFEFVDSRVKLPSEIATHLGLPFLGMIPAVDGETTASSTLLSSGAAPAFSEAFRSIRTNVVFSASEEGPRTIVVASTGPGEGKTLVSTNLAIALSQAGQRVLLVDADMRRPKVHETFELPQEPGLSNVIVGDTNASDAVRRTSVDQLWVLAAGRIPPNPAELLGSRRFKRFLESVGEHFDWVVIDSPPVMAVTDSAIVAHEVMGVLFVVGAEMTSRYAAKRALEQLERAKARFFGAVLNRVDLKGNAYYYSGYYRRSYANYYTSSSTPGSAEKVG